MNVQRKRNCKLTSFIVFSMFIFSFMIIGANATWWDTNYELRKEINITSVGSTTLTNFPAYINIPYETGMQVDFDDLRFLNGTCGVASPTELDYEIDNFTNSGTAHIWLEIPSLTTSGSSVCMYYGNPSASSGVDITGTWNSDYNAVWHFSETGTTTDRLDSTSSNYDAMPNSFDGDEENNSLIGRAISLDGTSDYLAIRGLSYSSQSISALTTCVWFNTGFSGGGYNANWAFIDYDRSEFYDFYIRGDTGALAFSTDAGGINDFNGVTTGLNNNVWHYGCAVYDGTDKIIYLNGNEDNRLVNAHSGNNLGGTTTRFGFIGDGSEAGSFNTGRNNIWYQGLIDEITLSSVARSGDWINQSYQLVSDQSNLVINGTISGTPERIGTNIISPSTATAYTLERYSTFDYNTTISCDTVISDCGNVTTYIQLYNATQFDNLSTVNSTPLWSQSSQPQSCALNAGNSCNLTWEINGTGTVGSNIIVRTYSTSNISGVNPEESVNLTVEIVSTSAVIFNQSTYTFINITKNTGSISDNLSVVSSLGTNTDIGVNCVSGDCGIITFSWANTTDLALNAEENITFTCSDSTRGSFSATFNVSSIEDIIPSSITVSCNVLPVFGPISVTLNEPTPLTVTNVSHDKTVTVNASVICNGTCGNISAYAVYDGSFGTGNDGSLTVTTADTIVNNYTALSANELAGQTILSVTDSSEFSNGDEVLIIQMQNGSGIGDAGNYEFNIVSATGAGTITVTTPLTNSYGSGTFNTQSASITQIVRIPNYANVNITSSGSIVPFTWNGSVGGIVAFRVLDTLTMSGYVNASERGFRGGDCNGCGDSAWGDQGEGYPGLGGTSTLSRNGNGGGGGYGPSGVNGEPGGGGGYATAGGIGDSTNDAEGGLAVGDANLTRILLGGGGGGGGDNDNLAPFPEYADGSGSIIIFAKEIDNARIRARGEGAIGSSGAAGVSGGGAGGAIWLASEEITVTDIDASGGASYNDGDDLGGAGGDGRIKIDTITISGTSPVPTVGSNGTITDLYTIISEASGSVPLWTSSSQPQSCIITEDGECSFEWQINASGNINSSYNISVLFVSNYSAISSNQTQNTNMTIINRYPNTSELYPINNSYILGNSTVEFYWNISDYDDNVHTCSFYHNETFVENVTCYNGNNTYYYTGNFGLNNWSLTVTDPFNYSNTSGIRYYTMIKNNSIRVSKEIGYGITDVYIVNLTVQNFVNLSNDVVILEFVEDKLNPSSFSPSNDFTNNTYLYPYYGTIYGWDLTLVPLSTTDIDYAVTSAVDYEISDLFIIGVE